MNLSLDPADLLAFIANRAVINNEVLMHLEPNPIKKILDKVFGKLKTTFPTETVILKTTCKSGSDCLVTQLSDTYNGRLPYKKGANAYRIVLE